MGVTICPMPKGRIRPYRARVAFAGTARGRVLDMADPEMRGTTPGLPKYHSDKIMRSNRGQLREMNVRKSGGAWGLTLRGGRRLVQQVLR